jgi:hypothetical protein
MTTQIITTRRGTTIDLSKPARATFATVLDEHGRKVMDTLHLTGNTASRVEFMEKWTEFECEGSFDTFFVSEQDLMQ